MHLVSGFTENGAVHAGMGKFTTISDYISDTVTAADYANFKPDQYRTPFLQQSIVARRCQCIPRLSDAQLAVNHFQEMPLLREPLLKVNPGIQSSSQETTAAQKSRMVINPHSFPIHLALPPSDKDSSWSLVDMPGMGFSWLDEQRDKTAKQDDMPVVVEGRMLRNEFCEVLISETTGTIKSIRDFRTRGNRVSQQIALRLPGKAAASYAWRDPDADAVYSIMVADTVETVLDCGHVQRLLVAGDW